MSDDLQAYYDRGLEHQRLLHGLGRLELARTQELIERYLPPPPAVVYDVGGGSGVYAGWLARRGYHVHLVDAIPLHVDQARQVSAAQPAHPLASASVGDARRLAFHDASADAVLLLGPLYHLVERTDRLEALREAARVLRPGGILMAAGISRFASTFDGLFGGGFDDPAFYEIARQDRLDGQHRNPGKHPGYFTTAYFHLPAELQTEIEATGLNYTATLAIEGPGSLLPRERFDRDWDDPIRRARLLEIVRALEAEPSLLGISPHLMGIARLR